MKKKNDDNMWGTRITLLLGHNILPKIYLDL